MMNLAMVEILLEFYYLVPSIPVDGILNAKFNSSKTFYFLNNRNNYFLKDY